MGSLQYLCNSCINLSKNYCVIHKQYKNFIRWLTVADWGLEKKDVVQFQSVSIENSIRTTNISRSSRSSRSRWKGRKCDATLQLAWNTSRAPKYVCKLINFSQGKIKIPTVKFTILVYIIFVNYFVIFMK